MALYSKNNSLASEVAKKSLYFIEIDLYEVLSLKAVDNYFFYNFKSVTKKSFK